jgi:hypothetical protein
MSVLIILELLLGLPFEILWIHINDQMTLKIFLTGQELIFCHFCNKIAFNIKPGSTMYIFETEFSMYIQFHIHFLAQHTVNQPQVDMSSYTLWL